MSDMSTTSPRRFLTIEPMGLRKPAEDTEIFKLAPQAGQYNIIWISTGTIFTPGSTAINIQTPSVMCLSGNRHNSLQLGRSSQGYIIAFSENVMSMEELQFELGGQSSLQQLLFGSQAMALNGEQREDVENILSLMLKEQSKLFLFSFELLIQYLKIFIIHLSRHFEDQLQPNSCTRNIILVQQFMEKLEQNFRDKKMVSHYAKVLFVTPNYLNEVVKKVTGVPAGQHIRNRVVMEAKRIAISSNHSMKEIAYSLGFDDTAHFSKFFKSTVGSNFSSFKKQRVVTGVSLLTA